MDPNQIQPEPIQPEQVQQPVQTALEPVKSQNNFWLAFVIGVGIISFGTAIAIGGYIFGSQKKINPPGKVQVVTPSPSPSISPLPTLDPTLHWKLYKNQTFPYTVEYPTDFYTECGSYNEFRLYDGKDLIKGETCNVGEQASQFAITVQPTSDKPINTTPDCYDFRTEKMIVSGEMATKYLPVVKNTDPKFCDNAEGSMSHYIVIQFSHLGVNYQIGYSDDKQSLKEQIISSFKFADQNQIVDVSTWNTYLVNALFSIKYPQDLTAEEVKNFQFSDGKNHEAQVISFPSLTEKDETGKPFSEYSLIAAPISEFQGSDLSQLARIFIPSSGDLSIKQAEVITSADKLSGIKVTYGCQNLCEDILFISVSYVYDFRIGPNADKQEVLTVANQMISTLSFNQ